MSIHTEIQRAIKLQAEMRETIDALRTENTELRTKINSLKMEQIHTEAIRVINDAIPADQVKPKSSITMWS